MLDWREAVNQTLFEAQQRNGRLGNKKSRGGCITCKRRRVKCDETHPNCRRCTSVGRRCEGYTQTLAVPTKRNDPNDHDPLSALTTPQYQSMHNEHKRAFDFFISCSAPEMGRSLDKAFWTEHVLQVAHVHPSVMDALVAISTLYEHPQYLKSFNRNPQQRASHPDNASLTAAHATALRSYNKALRAVRIEVEGGRASPLMILLSCVLFLCIEMIRDNFFTALQLLAQGNDLLKKYANVKLVGQEQQLVVMVKLMLLRVGLLAAAYGHQHTIETPPDSLPAALPTRFSSVDEARTALYGMMGLSHTFIRDTGIYKAMLLRERGLNVPSAASSINGSRSGSDPAGHDDSTARGGPNSLQDTKQYASSETPPVNTTANITPSPSHQGKTRIYEAFETPFGLPAHRCDCEDPQCRATLDSIPPVLAQDMRSQNSKQEVLPACGVLPFAIGQCPYAGTAVSPSSILDQQRQYNDMLAQWRAAFDWDRLVTGSQELAAASSLFMYYHVCNIWLNTRLTLEQTTYDSFTEHFEGIVHHAERYIHSHEGHQPVFTFEIGAVTPLYFTATKCRIPSLRRKALDLLLRSPKKEAMWGAQSSCQVAARVTAIEEENLGLPEPSATGGNIGDAVSDAVLPPESDRVHNLEILIGKSTGQFEIRVARHRVVDGKLQKVLQDYPI